MRTRRLLALLCLGSVPACWDVPDDDAGDEAFVVWATVTVLGRRPYTHDEVDVLAELSAAEGREAVLDVLMEQPEYLNHWSRRLVDHLRIARSEEHAPPDETCFTETKLAESLYGDLVDHLQSATWTSNFCPDTRLGFKAVPAKPSRSTVNLDRYLQQDGTYNYAGVDRTLDKLSASAGDVTVSPMESPTVGGLELSNLAEMDPSTQSLPLAPGRGVPTYESCESFTMMDALRASLAEDHLDAAMRAGLIPLGVYNTTDGQGAAELVKVYLGRDPACVACHTTHYSTTDALPRNDEWDRFEPANRVDLEGSAFSWTDTAGYHYGGDGGDAVTNHLINAFRGDQFQSAGGRAPFGIDGSCVTQTGRFGFRGTIPHVPSRTVAFAGLNSTTSGVGALIDQFAIGTHALSLDALDDAPWPDLDGIEGDATNGAVLAALCEGCHFAGNTVQAPEDLVDTTSRMTANRLHDIIQNGSPAGLMAGLAFSDEDVGDIVAYYMDQPGHEWNQVYPNPAASFAHLTAQRVANAVYEEITGVSLVMPHGYPRNADAAATLEELTRVLIVEEWSLRSVIKRVLLSELANRRAPVDSPWAAYVLPVVLDPFADVNNDGPDPEVADSTLGRDYNGQGDAVHRWPIPTLLRQLQFALLWPEPPLFPQTNPSQYADLTFQVDVGAFVNHRNEGSPDPGLAALLAWEAEIATCDNPFAETDVIDLLTDPDQGLTLEQAMLAVKDRLVSYGGWWGDPDAIGIDGPGLGGEPPVGERDLAGALTTLDLTDPAADDPQAVRDYCAAVLRSPDFLLSGLPPWEDGDAPPDADPAVPCADPVCGWSSMCEYWSDAAEALGYDPLDCEVDDIAIRG